MASTACSPALVSKVTCPECGKILQLRSFSYRHSCKQPRKPKSPEQLAIMATKLQTRAVERFYKRKGLPPPIDQGALPGDSVVAQACEQGNEQGGDQASEQSFDVAATTTATAPATEGTTSMATECATVIGTEVPTTVPDSGVATTSTELQATGAPMAQTSCGAACCACVGGGGGSGVVAA